MTMARATAAPMMQCSADRKTHLMDLSNQRHVCSGGCRSRGAHHRSKYCYRLHWNSFYLCSLKSQNTRIRTLLSNPRIGAFQTMHRFAIWPFSEASHRNYLQTTPILSLRKMSARTFPQFKKSTQFYSVPDSDVFFTMGKNCHQTVWSI